MNIRIDPGGFDDVARRIGDQVRGIVNTTTHETVDHDLEQAIDTLHAVDGLDFNRDWCRNALETLRRGGNLQIRIG